MCTTAQGWRYKNYVYQRYQQGTPASVQVTGAGVCRNQANQLAGAGMLLKPVVVVGDLIALAIPPGDIADGVAAADQDACFML